MKKYVVILNALMLLVIVSCTDDAQPFTNEGEGWYYEGSGSADINPKEVAYVNFNIENNLNVNGKAYITDAISIGDDVNLNAGGVTIHTPLSTSIVNVEGNVNVNDSLFVNRGILEIDGELNLNAGILIVSDSGQVIVRGNLNNSSQIIGMDNVTYYGEFNNHSKAVTSTTVSYNPSIY